MIAGRDSGMVEALPLAMLTFVVGALVLAHAWAVVNTRQQASAAARSGARAYVESDPTAARSAALDAARGTLARTGDRNEPWTVDVTGRSHRCRPVTVRVSTVVPLIRLPWIGPLGAVAITATHSEIVDPFRRDLPGVAICHA